MKTLKNIGRTIAALFRSLFEGHCGAQESQTGGCAFGYSGPALLLSGVADQPHQGGGHHQLQAEAERREYGFPQHCESVYGSLGGRVPLY